MESVDEIKDKFNQLERKLRAQENFMNERAQAIMENFVGDDFEEIYSRIFNFNELLSYYQRYVIKGQSQNDKLDQESMQLM